MLSSRGGDSGPRTYNSNEKPTEYSTLCRLPELPGRPNGFAVTWSLTSNRIPYQSLSLNFTPPPILTPGLVVPAPENNETP